jgi:hypothetical protein
VLGYLDDLILIPLGVALVVRWVPADVMADAKAKAHATARRPTSRGMAFVIVAVWLVLAGALAWWAWARFGTP